MKGWVRGALLGLLCASGSSCLDDEVSIVDNSTTTPGPPGPPGPPAPPTPGYSIPVPPAGPSGFHEEVLAADLGSDAEPRLVFRFGQNDGSANNQIRASRRRADGSWTAPVGVSNTSTDFKDNVQAVVSRGNDFLHVFWIQGPSVGFNPRLFYAQLDDGDPPAVAVGPLEISTGPVAGLGGGAAFNDVLGLSVAIDRLTDDVGALWVQEVVDGASLTCAIAGVVVGGSGAFGERIALSSAVGGPEGLLLRASPLGGLHALYAGPRHRARTGPGAWTSGPDGQSLGVSTFNSLDLAFAADGDAYAVWTRQTFGTFVARRPAGGTFGAAQAASSSGGGAAERLRILVEPGTEHVHVVRLDLPGFPQAPSVVSHPAADLSGAWGVEAALSPTTTSTVGTRTFEAFVDAGNALTVVWYGPAFAQEPARILARTRPSGGAFAAAVDLTAAYAFPVSQLVLGRNAAGQAVAAWTQGEITVVPASEIFASRYTPGTGFAPPLNVSRTPSLPSHATTLSIVADDGRSHLFWNEWATRFQPATPSTDDAYHAIEP